MKPFLTTDGKPVFLLGVGAASYDLAQADRLLFMLCEPGTGKPVRALVTEAVPKGEQWAVYGSLPEPTGPLFACNARQFQLGGDFREAFSADVTTMDVVGAPHGTPATLRTVAVKVEAAGRPERGEVWRTKHGHSLIVTEPPEFNQQMVGGVYLTDPYAGRYARVTLHALTHREAASGGLWCEQSQEAGRERAGD